MISIEQLRKYYQEDAVFVTEHAAERARQRGIKARDIRHAVETGLIIEQYPEDYPYPSCLILGKNMRGQSIHVCMSDEGSASRIITAYYPDSTKWNSDYSERKEHDL